MKFDSNPIDYSKADSDSKPLAQGEYTGVISDETELVETSSGNAGVKVKMRLHDGPEGPLDRPLTDTIGLVGAAWKVAQLSDACGVERPTAITDEASANAWISSLRGATVRIKVKHDTYNKGGESRTTVKVDRYLARSEASVTAMTAGARRRAR